MLSTILLIGTLVAFGAYIYKFPPKLNASNNHICMDYSKEQMNELNVNLVHTMVNGYKDKQLRYIQNTMSKDAHSIWFDLETLKKFIYHTEVNTKKNNKSITSKHLGLRIYYANYPERATWGAPYSDLSDFNNDPITQQYSHLHTLVAIPTIRRKNGINADFNPMDVQTYTTGLKNLEYYSNPAPSNVIPAMTVTKSSRATSNSSSGAQNHGSLIPPADGSGEGF